MPTVTTPMFVAVASDDQLGLMPHSIQLYEEWNKAKQPAELHVYEMGDMVLASEKIKLHLISGPLILKTG